MSGTHRPEFPDSLSRDFASCIIARKHGFRSASVDEAVCYVPRGLTWPAALPGSFC